MATEPPRTAPDEDPGNEEPGLNLPLIIGVAVGALVVMVIVILVILWRTGKLRKRRSTVMRHPHGRKVGSDVQHEERKKSIVVVAPSHKQGAELYIVRHHYEAEDENQMTLESGRIIEVVEKMDNGWWRGVTGDREGWFPATFVKKIDVSDPTGGKISPDATAPAMPTESFQLPTPKPSPDKSISSKSGASYVNGGFSPEGSHPTGSKESTKKRDKKNKKAKDKNTVKHSESDRLSGMENGDIEGYLNEIFSVEDETTPESPRRTPKIKPHNKKSPRTKSITESDSISKKKKNQANSKKLQEQAISNKTKNQNKKNVKITGTHQQGSLDSLDRVTTNGVATGSPLINPVRYMISSSESLISSSSCFADSEKNQSIDSMAGSMNEVDMQGSEVKVTEVKPCTEQEQEADRGAPDGSSLVEVLPDHKELSCTTEQDPERSGGLDRTDDSDVKRTPVKSELSFVSNLKNQLKNRAQRQSYVAMYPFTPSDHSQLTLARNDVIFALSDVEENGWIKGEKKGSKEVGWFPKSYVREGKSPPGNEDVLSEESEAVDSEGEFEQDEHTGLAYRVLYPYEAQQQGDLTIAEGDTVVVLETVDSGWWRGCHGDHEGWFPGTYVEPVAQTPVDSGTVSPFHGTSPLYTSSPTETVSESQSKRQSLPTHLEDTNLPDIQVPVAASEAVCEQKSQLNVSKTSPSKRQSMPPLSSKPDLPKRFVSPKQLHVHTPVKSRHRKDAAKVSMKPSRPPPPIPKNGPDPARLNTLPGSVRLEKAPKMRHVKPAMSQRSDKKRRESFPRPAEPPPPAPTTSEESSPSHSYKDSVFEEESPHSAFLEAVDHEDDGDILLAKIKKNSLPGVHKGSPRTSDGDLELSSLQKTKVGPSEQSTSSSGPEIPSGDYNSDEANPGDSSLSFNAIMNIFEKIADKCDSSVNSLDSEEEAVEESAGKPKLPPKSIDDKRNFRRVVSDPDLTKTTGSAGLSLPQDGRLSGISASDMTGLGAANGKPALPPRPKTGPQRSVSTSALPKVDRDLSLGARPDINAETLQASGKNQKTVATKDTDKLNGNPDIDSQKKLDTKSNENPNGIYKPDKPAKHSGLAVMQGTKHTEGYEKTVSNGLIDEKIYTPDKEIVATNNKVVANVRPPRPSFPPKRVSLKGKDGGTLVVTSTDVMAGQIHSITESPPRAVNHFDSRKPIDNAHHQIMPDSPDSLTSTGSDRLETVHLGRGLEVVGELLKNSGRTPNTPSRSTESQKQRSADSEVTKYTTPSNVQPVSTEASPKSHHPPTDSSQEHTRQSNMDPTLLKTITSPLNIKTNPMRFFSPMGYSRAVSPSSTVSSTTLSPLTLSPMSTGSSSSHPGSLERRADNISSVRAPNGSNENINRKTPTPSPSSKDSSNPLRFYTPPGFILRRGSAGDLDSSREVPGEKPITNSLPSLFFDSLEAKTSPEDYYSRVIMDQRNHDTSKLQDWESSSGDSKHVYSESTVNRTFSRDRNGNSDVIYNGYSTASTAANGRQRQDTPLRPRMHSGDPLREGRELNKRAMSHQLKLVALKSDDLESDV